MFNWTHFLDRQGIAYSTEGKNVRKGQIAINCPLCSDDSSNHCNIDPLNNRFSCWRNNSHFGTHVKLIQILTNLTYKEALELVQDNSLIEDVTEESLLAMAKRLFNDTRIEDKGIQPIVLDESFISPTEPFKKYLLRRKFDNVDEVIEKYELKCAAYGKWSWRLIIPFKNCNDVLIGWTGRSISSIANLRYLTWPEGPQAKEIVYNCNNAKGGKVLVICEGPMDAIKGDAYGSEYRVNYVAMVGLNMLPEQINMIGKLSSNYDKVVVVTDKNAEGQGLSLCSKLAFVNAEYVPTPSIYKDLGDMPPEEIHNFSKFLLTST